jgi:hypothetical protein
MNDFMITKNALPVELNGAMQNIISIYLLNYLLPAVYVNPVATANPTAAMI